MIHFTVCLSSFKAAPLSLAAAHDASTSRRTQLEVMGLAAGGKLIQDLVVDRNIWNTSRTRLINLHIFSPASFEAVTHIVPPETPVTARAYADAGPPFYVVEEYAENRLNGSDTLDAVKSVSRMDEQVGVEDCSAPSLYTKTPKRCGVCKIRLCDCMCVVPPQTNLLSSGLMNYSCKCTTLQPPILLLLYRNGRRGARKSVALSH